MKPKVVMRTRSLHVPERRRVLHSSVTCMFASLAFSVATLQGAVIATPGSGTSGGYYAYEPFGLVESGQASCRYQQVYASSEFDSELPGGGLITGLIFASDFNFGHGFNAIRYFNNQEPSGKLIQGTAGFGGSKVDELATQIEDALTFCL